MFLASKRVCVSIQALFLFTFGQTICIMVTFNELRICEDGNNLVVDCEINGVDVYDDMYIQSIYLEHYKNASSVVMPGDKAYLLYDNEDNDTSVRSKRIVFNKASLSSTQFGITSFDGELFYAIVICDGDLPAETSYMPCGADDTRAIGAIPDWGLFYTRGIGYIASLFDPCGDPCQPTDEFEHFILLWNAFKLAIETCDWELVKDLWDKFRLAGGSSSSAQSIYSSRMSGCGCGR